MMKRSNIQIKSNLNGRKRSKETQQFCTDLQRTGLVHVQQFFSSLSLLEFILWELQVNLNQQSESYYGEDPIIKMDGGIDKAD
jgi:hypothetical protein